MKQLLFTGLMIIAFISSVYAQNTTTIETILPFCEKFDTLEVEEEDGLYYLDDMMVNKVEKPPYYDFLYSNNPDVIDQATVVSDKNYLWRNGVVPYAISPNISASKRQEIQEAINTINSSTNLRITPRSSETDYIYFKPHASSCSSFVGRIGGKQDINVSDWCGAGSLMHEILHSIGFYHEQSRPDRDRYIRVNWSNIEASWRSQYTIVNTAQTIGSYDYASIMHYGRSNNNFDCLSPCPEIGNRSYLSQGDIYAINYLYPRQAPPPSPPVSVSNKFRVAFQTNLSDDQVFESVIVNVGGVAVDFGVSFKDTAEGVAFILEEGKQYKYEVYVECMEFSAVTGGFSLKRRRGEGSGYITASKGKTVFNLSSNRRNTAGDYVASFQ